MGDSLEPVGSQLVVAGVTLLQGLSRGMGCAKRRVNVRLLARVVIFADTAFVNMSERSIDKTEQYREGQRS
jgi:hypothetical protein